MAERARTAGMTGDRRAALDAAPPNPYGALTMTELEGYRYRGARALVLLHERELRDFVATWRRAVAWGVTLPAKDDPDCASADAMARHVLSAAGRYMIWLTQRLGLPDPAIADAPPVEEIGARADAYLEHVLERWRTPLRDVPEARFAEAHRSNWGEDFTLESMLEHAVVHPMRHALQLEELMGTQAHAS
jgi:hypothetical protein